MHLLAALKAGLPRSIAEGLAKRSVVVVELWSARDPVGKLSAGEARQEQAGLGAASVGSTSTGRRRGRRADALSRQAAGCSRDARYSRPAKLTSRCLVSTTALHVRAGGRERDSPSAATSLDHAGRDRDDNATGRSDTGRSQPPARSQVDGTCPMAARGAMNSSFASRAKTAKSIAIMRAVDYGAECVVETEVFPPNAVTALRPGPYSSRTHARRPHSSPKRSRR